MKKAMLLALAALSVSVAQAVTVSWTFTNNTLNGETNQNLASAIYKGSLSATYSDFTGATAATYITVATSGNFGNLVSTSDTLTWITSTRTEVSSQDSYSDSLDIGTVEAGTYTLVVSDSWWYNRGNNNSQISTEEAQGYLRWIEFTISEEYAAYLNNTSGTIELSGDGLLVMNDSTSQTTPITTADGLTVLVPEPTCLALLALGVAGLALCRRA